MSCSSRASVLWILASVQLITTVLWGCGVYGYPKGRVELRRVSEGYRIDFSTCARSAAIATHRITVSELVPEERPICELSGYKLRSWIYGERVEGGTLWPEGGCEALQPGKQYRIVAHSYGTFELSESGDVRIVDNSCKRLVK